jgi:hypothetical protein
MLPVTITLSDHLPPLTIVSLTGLAGSGKDTVADTLVAQKGFTKVAFADALRAEVAAAFDIDVAHLTQRETKEHPISTLALDRCLDPKFVRCMATVFATAGLSATLLSAPRSPRQIMQWWGTEYRRAQDDDYWVKRLYDTLMHAFTFQFCDLFVIPDCRFENEAVFVRRNHGQIWQVVRPGLDPTEGAHVSATDGSQFLPNALLENTHSIAWLQQQAMAAYNHLSMLEVV